MKLLALITPRGDGMVLLEGRDGNTYTFDGGELLCDVEHPETLVAALMSGNFAPADEADFDEADRLVSAAGMRLEESADDEDTEDDDEQVDPDAMPVEAATPPKRYKPRKRKAA